MAETNGKIVGFINGAVAKEASLPDQMYHDASLHDPNGAYQTVFGLDVLPAYRRNGIAGRLLERMIHHARECQRKGVVLTCKDHLVHYYAGFGFKHCGVADSTHGGAKWNEMKLLFKSGDALGLSCFQGISSIREVCYNQGIGLI